MFFDAQSVAELKAIIKEYQRSQDELVTQLARAHETIDILKITIEALHGQKGEREEASQKWDDY